MAYSATNYTMKKESSKISKPTATVNRPLARRAAADSVTVALPQPGAIDLHRERRKLRGEAK
jgi:hypothetical protein